LKLGSFFKMHTNFTRNLHTFKNSNLLKNDYKKEIHVMYWDNYKHFYNNLQ
jgi:hypothetical protein